MKFKKFMRNKTSVTLNSTLQQNSFNPMSANNFWYEYGFNNVILGYLVVTLLAHTFSQRRICKFS